MLIPVLKLLALQQYFSFGVANQKYGKATSEIEVCNSAPPPRPKSWPLFLYYIKLFLLVLEETSFFQF